MREIKFRGKDFLGRWHYGYLHLATGSSSLMIQVDSFDSFGVLPETVGQFTGLLDKNGKEIYEGDIVHLDSWKPNAMQIKFVEAAFCLADENGEYLGDIHYTQHAQVNQCTVLGNIHDNPELLKTETL